MNGTVRPIIGVVSAMANGIEQKQIISGIAAEAQKLGYDTAVFSNIYNLSFIERNLVCEQRIYELIRSDQIDGIVLIAESFVNAELRCDVEKIISEKNVPVVLAGAKITEFENPNYINVNTDDSAGTEALTNHLIEEHGYTDIDIITGPEGNEISEQRIEGYVRALKKHGLTPKREKIHYGSFWIESGTELAGKYSDGTLPMPRAVVCANHYMAYGMLTEFAKRNVKVPEQIAVVGYEYSDRRVFHYPLLTSYKRNREQIGTDAVRMIHSILSGKGRIKLTQPEGKLICGESCPCVRDVDQYCRELENVATQKDYSDWNLFATMEQELTGSRSLDEFIGIIGSYQWLIRYVQNVYLCLYSNWYEGSSATTEQMVCRSIMPWLDNSPFELHRFDFAKIFSRDPKPSVFYFNPLFINDRLLGHMVLKYDNPDGYDDVFRNWLKAVTNGLEFLRMKNDIQYLTNCQDLSEFSDTLTGMYNEKGLKRAYSTAENSSKQDLLFIVLKIGLFDDSVFNSEKSSRIEAVTSAAAAVEKFCVGHDISGHISENLFVCIVQNRGNADLLLDALSAILIQQKKYVENFGMDSFMCVAEECSGRTYDELLDICLDKLESRRKEMAEKRSQIHYKEVIELRNTIYTSPEFTFDTEGMFDDYTGNPNHLKMLYKKCFGISFHQDCIAARISRAKYYLATTAVSMGDIAEKCGYLDNKYFLRQFTSTMDITAGQYRNMIKG